MNAWLPQASYPCGNFSDTSRMEFPPHKGSLGPAFTARTVTGSESQVSFYPYVQHEISVLIELTLGHLCYHVADVPPQPNSPSETFPNTTRPPTESRNFLPETWVIHPRCSLIQLAKHRSKCWYFNSDFKVSQLCYTLKDTSQFLTRVKLNRVFFPR
jgi:hypothetical protein